MRARAAKAPRSLRAQLGHAYSLQFQSRTRARVVAERALALDATNIDAQVAVIVLGFDKDQPAQAVGRLAQLMRSRARRTEPALPLRRAASWIGQQAEAKKQYRQALALDPSGLIGRFARSVLNASSRSRADVRDSTRRRSPGGARTTAGMEHSHLAPGFGRAGVLAALGDDEPFDVATMALSPVDEIEDDEEGEAKAYADAEADADEDDEPAVQRSRCSRPTRCSSSCATSAA